ncbi:MAG: hypothetical protein HY040_26845 [Planctomycetes bacterium]|nr:hypothetical protein [Planctomycetota bacterium]
MNDLELDNMVQVEDYVRSRLSGRIYELRVLIRDQGLVLQGRARTYYAKQLAQHVVGEASELPIRANEIEVT